MATPPGPNISVLAPTNTLKRALSEDEDSDIPEPKKIRLKSENPATPKDRKKRKKKKKKTPVVVALELPASSLNDIPSPVSPTKNSMGKRKAASTPPLQLEPDSGGSGEQPHQPLGVSESNAGATAQQSRNAEEEHPENKQSTSSTIAKLTEQLKAQSVLLKKHEAILSRNAEEEQSENGESSSSAMAKLTEQLKAQSALLKKHEATMTQFSHSLTCQVCLDLLHKPYALAPCGHIACYNCLVAWFTSEPEDHHMGPKRKTCPNCRATIRERPVEVWNIKEMVGALSKSGLVDVPSTAPPPAPALPGPPPPAGAPHDPWHNIFRYPHQHPGFHPPLPNGAEPPSVEDMGMLDAEDGVYRCLDCMHEIWDGICTSCQREYTGHRVGHGEDIEIYDDSDGEGDDGPMFWPHFLPFAGAQPFWNLDDDDDEEGEDDEDGSEYGGGHIEETESMDGFIDDGDEDEHGSHHGAAHIIEIDDDSDDDGDNSAPLTTRRRRRPRLASSDDEEDGGDEVHGSSPPRVFQPAESAYQWSSDESEVVIVSDEEDLDHQSHRYRSGRGRARIVESGDEDDNEGGDGEEDAGGGEYEAPVFSRARDDESDDDAESVSGSPTFRHGMDAGDLAYLMMQGRFEEVDDESRDGSSDGYCSDY
ncbi:RING-type domain-containing protein [Favolaschia claudopus]|uniref:RING-type domain-containing protein n=1 Tax=Favolaschia claudopus TaxID=2862362 RepID=A0AAW0CV01_9AGAR